MILPRHLHRIYIKIDRAGTSSVDNAYLDDPPCQKGKDMASVNDILSIELNTDFYRTIWNIIKIFNQISNSIKNIKYDMSYLYLLEQKILCTLVST